MGKLVSQNPKDEPASLAFVESGVEPDLLEISADECRFTIPASWSWIRFAGVGEQRLGKMLDSAKNRGELKPYLRNTNVQWMRFDLDDIKEMRLDEGELS